MAGGQYTIRVHGVLDDSQIRAQLAAIQKEFNTMGFGGKGGKGTTYFAQTGKDAKKSVKSVKAYSTGMTQATKQNKKFGASTLDITKKVIQFGATTAVIRGVTSGMGDMVKNVYELDGALTEFKKVSDLSGKGLEKYTDQAYKVGKTVARTGTEMVQAATEFKKAGYNEKDSMELARVASMYQNVADVELTAGEAANFIVSQMKAFNLTAQDSEHIIDAVNEVSNNFAVSSADIATNIGKASAALATGNVTYEQSIGLMTAMTEITRNGAKSARGLVSIQSRYNQIIDESSSTGKKLTAWYKEHNIAIKDQNGQLKSFFEVGGEVAKIWDTLSDNEKKYYLNTQAGANQSQNLAALMSNYKTVLEATAKAEESSKGKIGSAAKENARYMESMEGKLKNLKSAWEDFSRKLIDSDMLKNAIDSLTKLVNFLTTDVGQGFVKAAAGAIMFGGAVKLVGGLLSLVLSPLKSATKIFGLFGKSTTKATKELKGYKKGLNVVKAPTLNGAKNVSKLGKSMGGLAAPTLMASGLLESLGAILTNPAGLIVGMLALGAGIMYVNTKLNEYQSPEKQYERTSKTLDTLEGKYQQVCDEIDRLNKKREEGTITSSEEAQLSHLEEEREAIQQNIEAYRELAKAQKTAAARTPDPEVNKTDKVKSKQRPVTKASPLGAMEKQVQKDAGAVDLLSSKMVIYEDKVKNVAEAEQKVAKARENAVKAAQSGDPNKMAKAEEKLTKALDEQEVAQKDVNKAFKDMNKTNKELKEFYGSQERMPDDIRKSSEAVDKMVASYKSFKKLKEKGGEKGVDFTGLSGAALDKTIDDMKNLGDAIGITVDESGKLQRVNFDTMSSSMQQMGYTAEETKSALKMLGEQHPEATFEIEGVEVAGKDIDTVLDYLDKADGDDAEATIEINGTDVAVSDIKDINQLAKKLDGTEFKPIIDVEGGEESAQVTGEVTHNIESIPDEKTVGIHQEGAETASGQVSSFGGTVLTLPNGKTVTVTEDGSLASAGRVGQLVSTIGGVQDRSVQEKATTSGTSGVQSLVSAIGGVVSKTVRIVANYVTKHTNEAHGTKNAPEGLAEVNEYGYEYIRDAKTGNLRVANKGHRGFTVLGRGDTVYTHAQSLRMRQEQKEELPKFAKGKKGKKKAQEAYNKKRDKIRKGYDDAVDDLEYKQELKHLSDKWLADQMQKKWDAYTKKLKKYNKSKKVKGWKKKYKGFKIAKGLGKKRKQDLKLAKEQARYDSMTEAIEREIGDVGLGFNIGGENTAGRYANTGSKNRYLEWSEVKKERERLQNLRDKHKISAEDYKKYMDELYHAYAESRMKMYDKDKITADEMKKTLENLVKEERITWQEYYDYLEEIEEREAEKARDNAIERIEDILENVDWLKQGVDSLANSIRNIADEGKLEAKETKEYLRDLYQDNLDHMMTLYQYGKKSYESMKSLVESYYSSGYLTAKEYYSAIKDLADEAMSKEQERISKLQEQASNENSLARSWLQRKISDLEKQNEELEKENELIELQMNLEKAHAKRIRVYREGVGFVYEKDTEAIKEATDALKDFNKQQENPAITELKNILELLDDAEELANIKNLENLTGFVANVDFGQFGTNTSMWTNWIQNNLATSNGLGLLLNYMDELKDPDDIMKFLNAAGVVSSSTVSQYVNKARYASGTLSARSGFARVAENGYEIALLGRGDAVMPHHISENLMEWGKMSPLEYAASANSGDAYMYQFDKLVLPNVHDANSFVNELRNLPNKALQFSGSRA